MKAIVTGGRDFIDRRHIFKALDKIFPHHVIHGGARGVDYFAGLWAASRRVPCDVYRPDYTRYSRLYAPKIRNQQMLDDGQPDVVIAFRGGRGTADMIGRAQRARVKIIRG